MRNQFIHVTNKTAYLLEVIGSNVLFITETEADLSPVTTQEYSDKLLNQYYFKKVPPLFHIEADVSTHVASRGDAARLWEVAETSVWLEELEEGTRG